MIDILPYLNTLTETAYLRCVKYIVVGYRHYLVSALGILS